MAEAPEVTPEQKEAEAGWKDLRKKPFASQMVFFLNVCWAQVGEEKDATFDIFLKFLEQNEKFGAKENIVSYPTFCKILQQLEDSNARIKEALAKAGDRPSMSKAFQALGYKLSGDVSLTECLLFLYEVPKMDLMLKPQSPCDAALREARAKLAEVEAAQKALLDEVARLEAELAELQEHNASPMKAIKTKQAIAAAQQKVDTGKVQRGKDLKAAQKGVTQAEEALAAETAAGTEASNWMRGKCEAAGKTFKY